MAMIDWVDRRMHNWARWVGGGGAGGLGYATVQYGSLSRGGNAGAVIPTDACEASDTHDQFVKLPPELRRTLELYYLITENRAQLSVKLACAVATVDARLTRAHRLLADAFYESARSREALRAQMQQAAQQARP